MLTVIIGLPACGKTTYYNQDETLKINYEFHDDFISNFIDGELIEDLKLHKNVCVADPRLCNFQIFEKVMKTIEEYIDKNNITLILFKNNKEQCLVNAKERKNKNVDNTIENYSKVYNLDNYKNYNYKILDVFK